VEYLTFLEFGEPEIGFPATEATLQTAPKEQACLVASSVLEATFTNFRPSFCVLVFLSCCSQVVASTSSLTVVVVAALATRAAQSGQEVLSSWSFIRFYICNPKSGGAYSLEQGHS
jgi:hypothetical protein